MGNNGLRKKAAQAGKSELINLKECHVLPTLEIWSLKSLEICINSSTTK